MDSVDAQCRPSLRADVHKTAERITELRRYMDDQVLNGDRFVCAHAGACRGSIRSGDSFFEGQLSHVGHHYDLAVGNDALRVVVVGQEYGHEPAYVPLDARYKMIHDESGLNCRYYTEGIHKARNPHMRGTTSALRVLFGKGLGADWEGEFAQTTDGERFHIFDAFALVNFLLCSAVLPGTRVGRSTKEMRRNCSRHFVETLKILEPTLLVLQGNSVSRWTARIFTDWEPLSPHLLRAKLGEAGVLICRFSHPSARGMLRWGARLDAPYLTESVEPTLRRALGLV